MIKKNIFLKNGDFVLIEKFDFRVNSGFLAKKCFCRKTDSFANHQKTVQTHFHEYYKRETLSYPEHKRNPDMHMIYIKDSDDDSEDDEVRKSFMHKHR